MTAGTSKECTTQGAEHAGESALTCRSCGNGGLKEILSLGDMPLADRLLTEGMLSEPEPKFELTLYFCDGCSLVQIGETVDPEVLYCDDYPYYSSFSDALLRHSRENALQLINARRLSTDSLVVEIASNDGYMLRNFREHGISVLGIDPAEGPAAAAMKQGVETMCVFFGSELAEQLASENRKADVIIANNVLAHVADLNGLVQGIRILLKRDGCAVIEVPYLRDLIDHCEFDTIYHEHLCYFSVSALRALFARNGLHLNHVERLAIHGGSLRLFVGHDAKETPELESILRDERRLGVDQLAYFESFAERVQEIRASLRKLLRQLRDDGKRIAAYGAAAKGATLINYVGIGRSWIDFVVDRNTHKQGKFMPGQHIAISETDRLVEDMPDYVLMLAWNFASEIMEQQAEYVRRGGRFIIPVPSPRIVPV